MQIELYFAAILIGLTGAFAQTATPGNCVCPTGPPPPPPPMQDNNSNMNTGMDNSQNGPSGQTWGRPPRPSSMMYCDNKGGNYSSPCDLVNAQSQDNTLGLRACVDLMTDGNADMILSDAVRLLDMMQSRGSRQHRVCFTDNHSAPSYAAGLMYMQTNSGVGLRCLGTCPCSLACPSFRSPPRPMWASQMSGSGPFGNSMNAGRYFGSSMNAGRNFGNNGMSGSSGSFGDSMDNQQ